MFARPCTTARTLTFAGLIAAGSVLSTSSHAALFCATTGDQLASALATADSNGADDEIRVSIGTKTRPSLSDGLTRWSYVEAGTDVTKDLILTGGWDSSCTLRFPSPPTFLDAELGGPALDIRLGTNSQANVQVSGFDIVRGYTADSFAFSGFRLQSTGINSPLIVIDRIRVRNSGSDGDNTAIVALELNTGGLTFRNSQASQNRTYSAATVMLSTTGNGQINFVNNSVIDNTDSVPTSTGPVGGVSAFGSGSLSLYNNVLYDNTSVRSVDLSIENGVGLLSNNHIGILSGTPDANSGRTSGDPKITFNNSWYPMLAADSLLRDSGSTFVPGGAGSEDIRGLQRIQGARIDRGAIEFDSMFANGFE